MSVTYYAKKINADVPISDVLSTYANIHTHSQNSIKCPSIYHEDRHPSAKIYNRDNSCHCFSCNKSFSVIDIVMEHTGLPYPEACERIIQDFGLSRSIYTDEAERKKTEIAFPLTSDELELIGIVNGGRGGSFPLIPKEYCDADTKPKIIITPSLQELWYKDKKNINIFLIDHGKVAYQNTVDEINRFIALRASFSDKEIEILEDCYRWVLENGDAYINKQITLDKDLEKRLNDYLDTRSEYTLTALQERLEKIRNINSKLSKIDKKINKRPYKEITNR